MKPLDHPAEAGSRQSPSCCAERIFQREGNMHRIFLSLLLAVIALALMPFSTFAQSTGNQGGPCPRPAAASAVLAPPDLFSGNGVLNVTFNYFTTLDSVGRTLFCFVTPSGQQAPTLHVAPGDTLNVTVTNQVPPPP